MKYLAAVLAGIFIASSFEARADAPYPACTKKNDYLEGSLSPASVLDYSLACRDSTPVDAPVKFSDLERFGRRLVLPPECIRTSQARAPEHGYRWAVCSKEKTLVSKGIARPCQSENYHFFIYASYLEAMSCLGIDPRETFGLFNLESSFQLNIGSHTGAWGVGQLTGVAIKVTNAMKRLEPYKEKPECASVKAVLEKPLDSKHPCGWIEAPRNPTGNFLYAGMAYLTFKSIAEGLVKKYKLFSKMSPADKERAAVEITRYLYNGGDGGVLPALRAFVSDAGDKPMPYANFREGFRLYLKDHYGESVAYYAARPDDLASKRKEVSMYSTSIDWALKQVEKDSGAKCSL